MGMGYYKGEVTMWIKTDETNKVEVIFALENPNDNSFIEVNVSIPDPVQQQGKSPVLYFNSTNKTFSYEYVDIPPTTEEQLKALKEQLMTADQKYKALDLTTASLQDVQNAKIAQIRELYYQTLTSGFNVTISNTQYTFGWQSDDMTHMNATQEAINKGFLTFPILYADVNGNPVSIADQTTLDSIQSTATKFMMAQHQQSLKLVGNVQSATAVKDVDAIQWTPATY
jgi:hypothetical protein